MKNWASLAICLFPPIFSFAQFERVDADLKTYDNYIQTKRSEFEKNKSDPSDKNWVKSKISFMVEIDQYMRSMWSFPSKNNYTQEETDYFKKQFLPRNDALDSRNTDEIKELLKAYRWFTISEFGKEADSQAWLIVQHADLDLQFQKEILNILTDLWPKNETSPENYAYLFDRVAAAWGDPTKRSLQRYGTQGQCLGSKIWEPIPMEDPQHIDERRSSVGLNTLSEYKIQVKEFCP